MDLRPSAERKLAAALELLAVSHLLERVSPVLQELYEPLRGHCRRSIQIIPAENALVVQYPDAAEIRITETPSGRYRVRFSRSVPAGKRTKQLSEGRTCETVADVLHQIGKLMELEHHVPRTARTALKLMVTGPQMEPHVYAERIAFDFNKFLSQYGNPQYLSSPQVGKLLGDFIQQSKWSHVDDSTWRSVMRELDARWGVGIDTDDLESALRLVGRA